MVISSCFLCIDSIRTVDVFINLLGGYLLDHGHSQASGKRLAFVFFYSLVRVMLVVFSNVLRVTPVTRPAVLNFGCTVEFSGELLRP